MSAGSVGWEGARRRYDCSASLRERGRQARDAALVVVAAAVVVVVVVAGVRVNRKSETAVSTGRGCTE